MLNAIKVKAFASARPVSQQAPIFVLLADGSQMPLNITFVILHYKEFNFAWVRHGLPCILSIICRTFRSTQGLFYLVGGHARAAPWRVCSTLKSSTFHNAACVCNNGLHHLIQGLGIAFPHFKVCFAVSKKKRVMVRRGLHHFITQYKGFMFQALIAS